MRRGFAVWTAALFTSACAAGMAGSPAGTAAASPGAPPAASASPPAATPAAAAPGPAAAPAAPPPPEPIALEGLGPHRRPVTGASAESQRLFDQGLNLVYGFNHDEAQRAFARAAFLSPSCALCSWGLAYSNGPHINNPQVTPGAAKDAVAAVKKAQAAAAQASLVEQALIAALALRYADPQPEDRGPLDRAYAEAMRGVRKQHPGDADVLALTAEALMDLHPWDLWEKDGKPKAWTPEILEITEAALALAPKHPMANHLYIHAVEGSFNPERGDRAAETLRDLQPGLGHMVHMPSHIDVRTGRWAVAIDANRRAIAADEAYRAKMPDQGFYSIYMAHNHQMLGYAAMMSGRSAEAIAAMRAMTAGIPEGFRKEAAPFVDGYYALPLEALMRFGRWDEVLAEPDFGEDLPGARAMRHAARGVAYAAKDQPAKARDEQRLFLEGRTRVPAVSAMGQNPLSAVLDLVAHLLAGEILYREGKASEGFTELRLAVAAEDALQYDEPPPWVQPVRHALGAALLQSRRLKEAEAVFREDLRRVPGNGWALFGLGRALRLQGKNAGAEAAEKQFRQVWGKADVTIKTACFCQSGV